MLLVAVFLLPLPFDCQLVLVLNSLDFVHERMRLIEADLKWEEAAEGLPSNEAAEGASAIKVTLSSAEVTMDHQQSVILGKVVNQVCWLVEIRLVGGVLNQFTSRGQLIF